MSGRHAQNSRISPRTTLGGALLGVAAAGATAVSLIAAVPAQSAQKVTSVSAARNAAAPGHRVGPARRIPVPGRGNQAKAGRRLPPTAADTLKLAVAQVGISEDASGGGTKFQKWFVSSPWAERGVQRDGGSIGDYANANWCDMFVSWVGEELGVRGMGADAYTRTHAQWFKDAGRWGQSPKPGAVVFFSWNGAKSIDSIDHVGLVVKDNHDGTIETVEGNTDDAVKIKTRDVSSVVGYGYPEYGTATT